MKELIGKKILSIGIGGSEDVLAFYTDKELVVFHAFGDCCSETWFADITGVKALLGGTVLSVDEVSLEGYNLNDGRCRQEVDSVYGFKLTTDEGYADIVFRNSSNGYYGGSIGVQDPRAPSRPRPCRTDGR